MTETVHHTEELEESHPTGSTIKDIRPDDDELEGADEGEFEEAIEGEKVSPDKNDRGLSELNRWYERGRLILNPEWQRDFVWDKKRSSRLIESFLIDLPIPVVYLALNNEGKYEVIDGLQRLTSVFRFFKNEYELRGLEIKQELNGFKFEALPENLQAKLEDSTIRTFELPPSTPQDLMFVIFERLNTGGMTLTDMEIRNCLYRGSLNDLIRDLAKFDEFIRCVNQKNIQNRMKDRLLVLRFLAFYEMTYKKAKRGLKSFFNEFFETYRNPSDRKLKEFQNEFKRAIRAAYSIFGEGGFRLNPGRNVNASVFQVLSVSFTDYDLGALIRSANTIRREYDTLIETDDKWRDCVGRATGGFDRISYAFETWNEKLKAVMENVEPNDSRRIFPPEHKEKLYRENNVCEICGQAISDINDAVLDHIKHHWRGGQTVPENARLVHRHCNATRPHNE